MGAARELTESLVAFRSGGREDRVVEVRVNFGVFAGRNATQAEIDDLALSLREVAGSFRIVAEERHEFAGDVEISLRQIVVEVDAGAGATGEDADTLCRRVVTRARHWATACIESRSDLGELDSPL